ncbi:hypothetical protein BZG36_03944 [Bifiguratus adelaidae]|uniref:CBF1-interacting co-repressor CIR N-terminal domain-containing protein n=1 Tax=Bifiguratus adelaidae TaxID=1938954 RepID=A0A261XZT9_9FUNG|nr:hypothetical protein BZG36_03944 [Bifiguratus adelaidae]
MPKTNILQHKSWHVYNRENIERVKRDEAKAKEEEEAKLERVRIAASSGYGTRHDREARIQLLRERAKQRSLAAGVDSAALGDSAESIQQVALSTASEPPIVLEHINFWKDFEDNVDTANKFKNNAEHEAEKKAEQEKWERQLTMYLVQAKAERPWYGQAGDATRAEDPQKRAKAERIDRYVKLREDPLTAVNTHFSRGSKPAKISEVPYDDETTSHKQTDSKDTKANSSSKLLIEAAECHRPYKPKHRHTSTERSHRKHKSLSSERPHKSHNANCDESSQKSIEQLRAERMAREQKERARSMQLLHGDQEEQKGYHAQFNPRETSQAHDRRR